jgi:CRISPR-associated endonuclease Csy4
MNQYFDIEIKPDVEMQESQLLNFVYEKFHRELVRLRSDKVGVSFPDHKIKLGRIIRLHGNKEDLQNFQDLAWLGGMAGYSKVNDIKDVPSSVKYRTVSRIRTNMSKSKLERLKRRGSITTEEEKRYKAKMFSQGLDNSYVDLKSGSTGQRHRRFINFGPLLDQPVTGKFDSYGLSNDATVPWF